MTKTDNLTEKEVKLFIGKDNWNEFQEWMRGQTVPLAKDGRKILYYSCDVNQFKNILSQRSKQ